MTVTDNKIHALGPVKWVPYSFRHQKSGVFDGNLYFLIIGKWVCPLGVFFGRRTDDWCLNYALIKRYKHET